MVKNFEENLVRIISGVMSMTLDNEHDEERVRY